MLLRVLMQPGTSELGSRCSIAGTHAGVPPTSKLSNNPMAVFSMTRMSALPQIEETILLCVAWSTTRFLSCVWSNTTDAFGCSVFACHHKGTRDRVLPNLAAVDTITASLPPLNPIDHRAERQSQAVPEDSACPSPHP